jgi:ABC-2 type transport system permease protein
MILTILRILFLRLRNNPLELLLVFVIPVVFFSIFAVIFSKGIATGGEKKLRVGWVAGRETPLSVEVREFLETNSTLQCTSLIEETPRADAAYSSAEVPASESRIAQAKIEATIAEAQRSGRYDLIIRLSEDTPSRQNDSRESAPCEVMLVTDGQNPMAVAMVTSIFKGFFAQRQAARMAARIGHLDSSARPSSGRGDPREDRSGNAPGSQRRPLVEPASPRAPARRLQYLEPVKEPSQVFTSEWPGMSFDGVQGGNGDSRVSREAAAKPPKSGMSTEGIANIKRGGNSGQDASDAVKISVVNPQATTQENPRIAMYAAGVAVLFLLFSSTGNAAALLEEAESGTLDRILVSQAELIHIIGGKWLGILLLGCVQITVMFVWAELVFKIQLAEHLVGFCVMTISTSAATASFAMLLATLCRSRAQLNAVSVVIILSMSAVGGSMIPRFAMSDRMKEIGRWTFNAWALDGYQKVFWFHSPLADLRNEVAVLLGSSLVLGILALFLSGRWKRG